MEHNRPHNPAPNGPVIGPAIPPHRQRHRKVIVKEILTTAGVLLLAPLAAIIFTAFVFQFYRVDGPSMEETLHNNDRLIVYKLSKTFSNLTGSDYLPGRGDIVVFNRTEDDGGSRQLIKRVIGLPGDRVVIKNAVVRVFNDEHPEGYDPDVGTAHYKYTIPTAGSVDLTIPEGQVFVMGDNRDNSLDSRVFGTISVDSIVGTLAARVFPFKPVES